MAFVPFHNSHNGASVTLSDMDTMRDAEFQGLIGDLLKGLGYTDVQVIRSGGDQDVDILAVKDGKKYAIQCKHAVSPLNDRPIQKVAAGKAVYDCDIGVVLTNHTFDQSAVEAANATGTLLWDRNTLQKMLREASALSVPRKRYPALYVTGMVFLVFSGISLFSGIVIILQSGLHRGDIGLLLFFHALFLLGMFLVAENKPEKSNTKGYDSYQPYQGKKISWVAVGVCLYCFFPVGFYLLCKKMSQYADADELLRNRKTLKNWATVFICLGVFYGIIAYLSTEGRNVMAVAVAVLIAMGIYLLYKSNRLFQIYDGLSLRQKTMSIVSQSSQNMAAAGVLQGKSYAELLDNAERDKDTVILYCKNCNAPNQIAKGTVSECEYCGAPIEEDENEAAIIKAFMVMQRLFMLMEGASGDLNEGVSRLVHTMETSVDYRPFQTECGNLSRCLQDFTTKTKQVSAGIRAQVIIVCDHFMDYDEESWGKAEVEIERFSGLQDMLSRTISSIRGFRIFQGSTRFPMNPIQTVKMQLQEDIDKSLTILESAVHDFSESIETFQNAKSIAKAQRIEAQGGAL